MPISDIAPLDTPLATPATPAVAYAAAFDRVPSPLVVVDSEWRIAYHNPAMGDLSGWSLDEVDGHSVTDFVHPDDVARLEVAFNALIAAEVTERVHAHTLSPLRVRMIARDGMTVPLEVDSCAALTDPDLGGIVLSVRSVAYEHLITRVLTGVARGRQLAGVLPDLGAALASPPALLDVAIYEERQGRRRCVTASSALLADLDLDDVGFVRLSKHLAWPTGRVAVARFPAHAVDIVDTDSGEVFYARCVSPDGDQTVHLVGHSPAEAYASAGAYQRMVAGHELVDIVLSRIATDRLLDRAATRDSLTGLANRVGLERHVTGLREHGRRIAALYLDLDTFKPVNDAHGHAVGDMVLATIAERLRNCVRDGDVVARLGGDEFVAVIELPAEGVAADHAERVARRVLAALGEPVTVGAVSVTVSGSIGIAIAGAGEQLDELIRRADAAMYAAKRSGGGQRSSIG